MKFPDEPNLLVHLQVQDPTWQVLVSPNYVGELVGAREHHGVFFRAARVAACPGWGKDLLFYDANAHSHDANGFFVRKPAFGCFAPVIENQLLTNHAFMLGAFHTTFGVDQSEKVAEVFQLWRLFRAMKEPSVSLSSEYEVKDWFVAGDLNLSRHFVNCILEVWKGKEFPAKTCGRVQGLLKEKISDEPWQGMDIAFPHVANHVVQSKHAATTLSPAGELSDNFYDHLVLYDEEHTGFAEPAGPLTEAAVALADKIVAEPLLYLGRELSAEPCAGSTTPACEVAVNDYNLTSAPTRQQAFRVYHACLSDHLPLRAPWSPLLLTSH